MPIEHRNNSFDFLRLIAALSVTFSHTFGFYKLPDDVEILTGFPASKFGLVTFFALSGFLVTKSFTQSATLFIYARKRFLRIYPALCVVVLLTMVVFGVFLTNLPAAAYFSHPLFLPYLKTLSLLRTQYALTDIAVPNASLWTICLETRLYIWLVLMHFLGAFRRQWLFLGSTALFFMAETVLQQPFCCHFLPATLLDTIHGYTEYGVIFMVGAVLQLYPSLLSYQTRWLLFLGVCLTVCSFFAPLLQAPVFSFVLPYLAIQLGLQASHFTTKIAAYGDFSYGIYVYSFPIQCLIIRYFGLNMPPFLLFLLMLVFILPFAILSWHFIEKPALRLKVAD
ncbi:MAG: hypothetical protein RI894_918 [Bacteroidota bacterium]|jgi:peptidoglycan/LPS O-acetylase OafA/YrhL